MKEKLVFPKKYTKRGNFKLHSGRYSDVLYDVNDMLANKKYRDWIRDKLCRYYGASSQYVGIATGGAIIVSSMKKFAMIKDGELKGTVKGIYCLVDDVCTTEKSIRDAIELIGHTPELIFTVVDRRKEKKLVINSIYNIKE